jgi:hypothetical protein
LSGADLANIGFVCLGIDLHLGQILSDGEQRGRLQRGRHGLANIDVARHNGAINRGMDGGVIQVRLRNFHRSLFLLDLRSRLAFLGERR